MRAGRQYWHGTGGAAIAFGVGIVGGGLTSLGTASVFESITVGCLASIVTFLLELKLGEAPSRHSALLVDQLTGVEWLRDSVTEIAAAVVASRSSHPVVQARLRGDIELLAHKAQEAPTNRIIRSFVDNKVRLTLTHGLKRDLFAVTYDAVDFEIWGKETELGYFEAQKKFIARGGHIARIFILENRTDNLLQTMREHVDAGIHVYEVDASTLRERPQRRSLLHNLVVWDRTCCSTTFIPVGGEPWETTYSFVDEEIRQAAQDWRMLVSLSNRVPGPGRWAAPGCVRCLPTGPATRPRAVASALRDGARLVAAAWSAGERGGRGPERQRGT